MVLTSCKQSNFLSKRLGMDIYLKKDYRQLTGRYGIEYYHLEFIVRNLFLSSFKERGARNALMLLTDEQKKKGVIAASAGNN